MISLRTRFQLFAVLAASAIAACGLDDASSPGDEAIGEEQAAITDPNDTSPIEPPPRNLAVGDAKPDRMTISFTCGTHATNHSVMRRLDGGPETQIATLAACQAGTTVSVYDTQAQPGQSHCYYVRASNSVNAAVTNTLCRTTPLDYAVPTLPTGYVDGVSTSGAKLHFTDKSNNEGGFRVYLRGGGTSDWSLIEQVTRAERSHHGTGENFTFSRTGLSPDTVYDFKVEVYHDYAPVSAEKPFNFRTLPNPPSKPTDVHITDVTGTSLTLAWDDATGEDHYDIKKTEGPGSLNRTVGANQTSTSFTELSGSTKYCFKVVAENSGGSTESSTVCAATSAVDQTFNVHLSPAPPVSGWLGYQGSFGPITNGKLSGLEVRGPANHPSMTGFIFIPSGAQSDACDDPSRRVVVAVGGTASGADLSKLYGSTQPPLGAGIFIQGCPTFSSTPSSATPIITAHFHH